MSDGGSKGSGYWYKPSPGSLSCMVFRLFKKENNWPSVKALIEHAITHHRAGTIKDKVYALGTSLSDFFYAAYKPQAKKAGEPFEFFIEYALEKIDWDEMAKAAFAYYDCRISQKPRALLTNGRTKKELASPHKSKEALTNA